MGLRGMGFLRERGYRIRFDHGVFSRTQYLAGDDARRRAELLAALSDGEVRAILAGRGGYGANRIVHDLSWERLADNPPWIIGFSDITALHVEAARVGVGSLHAPHLNALGGGWEPSRAAWLDALESPTRTRVHALQPVRPGRASGVLSGGNLTILHACAAAGRLRLPEACILFLEDIGERPYRIDRALTTLIVGGHLSTVRGIVLGGFTDCQPGPDGARIEDVLAERLGQLGVPIVSGLPVGHGDVNEPLLLGARVLLDGSTLTVNP